MQRKSVNSSNIKSIGYDPQKQSLEVEFSSGGVYEYQGVSQAMADEFDKSESKGRFLQSRIKPNFQFRKMG